jgi:NadR type nicotinamide-nucleotide adenylyltransferase
MTRGLVLGKFLPYHAGHGHLIREARAQVDELVVLMCSIARETIPGGLRYQWVRASHPDCRVIHVSEEVPQAPEEHPDFWPIWTELVHRYAGRVERVFTSESYGDELARRLDATHVCVDPQRKAFPVSGTALRTDPVGNWRFVPECVRPYLVKRIALVGAESTGKTSLTAALAARFNSVWVPEYGRAYSEGRDPRTFAHVDFESIAWAQATLEDEYAVASNGILFCDTELHTTCAWSDVVLGECRQWLRDAAAARHYDAILLLDHDLPWVNDGTRVLQEVREDHTRRIENELRRAGRTWIRISGIGARREDAAARAIDEVLHGAGGRVRIHPQDESGSSARS